MRRILNRVDINQCAGLVRHLDDWFNGNDRAQRIGCVSNRKQTRLALERLLQLIKFERAVFDIKVHPIDFDAAILRG